MMPGLFSRSNFGPVSRCTAVAVAVALALSFWLMSPAHAGSRFLARAAQGGGFAPPVLPATAIPLPPLPLAAGAKVLALGDSEMGFNHGVLRTGTLGAAYNRMSGLMVTAWSVNPNFNFDTWFDADDPYLASGRGGYNGANAGIPGDHLDWWNPGFGRGCLNRTRYALARGPALVIINCGTNSISSGDTGNGPASADYVEAKLDAIVSQFASHGVWVVLSTLYPRADWPTGDSRHETLRQVNIWIRAQAGRPGVAGILDPYAFLVSSSDPDGVNAALFQEGATGVHPNMAGAWAIYDGYLKGILAGAIAPGSFFDQDATVSNLYPAATALANGGTAGTLVSGATGSAATGFTVTRTRGTSTVVASIEDAGTYKRQVVTVTPVNDAASTVFHEVDVAPPVLTSGYPAAGDWVVGYVHVETPDAVGPSVIRMSVNPQAGSTVLLGVWAHFEPSALFSAPTPGKGTGGYWLATPPFLMPPGANRIVPKVEIYYPKAMTTPFTVKLDRFILRTVVDPRAAWNLP
jgi:hypothetical protein